MMPLRKGTSRAAISENIALERRHGKPERQAIAIAMREAGKPKPAWYAVLKPKPAWYAVYEDGHKVSGSLSHAEATRAAVTLRERRGHGKVSVRAVKR